MSLLAYQLFTAILGILLLIIFATLGFLRFFASWYPVRPSLLLTKKETRLNTIKLNHVPKAIIQSFILRIPKDAQGTECNPKELQGTLRHPKEH